MNHFFRILSLILAVIVLVTVHIGTASFFSFPWSAVNIIVAACIIILLRTESGLVVWLAFFSHFFIELYTKTPFGVVLFSGTISMLFTYWLSQYIFTNKSWYTACALSFSAIIFYRSIYSLGIWFSSAQGELIGIEWSKLLVRYLAELGLTAALVLVLYLVGAVLIPTTDQSRYRLGWYGS